MSRYGFYFALLLLLGACTTIKNHGPIGFWSKQRYDQQLRQHGPWPAYYDATEQRYLARGRYRHGRYAGHWRYFGPTGVLERSERFAHHPYGLMTVTEYHPNGRKWRRGQARIVDEGKQIHFYWFGEWKVYDPAGQYLGIEHYDRGLLRGKRVLPSDSVKMGMRSAH
ncbi:toxin-antitoxin system YwqK family antitoxin [Hymenobacter crusticola]|uniref:MORN repeat variant n=1 Tax=Hymenobacter crusticola TaxID=1770526 RepID=A0A243WKZ0_9BACT|nr:hypothetical protein [Hymenobacter crusticola]OUJ76270.1 hypothetical protein BXP70_03160 [Hymenobacter crusticola]